MYQIIFEHQQRGPYTETRRQVYLVSISQTWVSGLTKGFSLPCMVEKKKTKTKHAFFFTTMLLRISIPLYKRSLCFRFTMSSSRPTLHVFSINSPRDSGSGILKCHSIGKIYVLYNTEFKHNHHHSSMPGPDLYSPHSAQCQSKSFFFFYCNRLQITSYPANNVMNRVIFSSSMTCSFFVLFLFLAFDHFMIKLS